MKIIGLTGGIGSGKSTVSDYLISKGYTILDADKISREIVEPGSETLAELKTVFGEGILLTDGSLDRKGLGQIVFSDKAKLAVLDRIMHARIQGIMNQKIHKFLKKNQDFLEEHKDSGLPAQRRVLFIDAPLLFEAGLDKLVGEIWVVDVDDETRIKRIIERDGLSRSDIMDRIARQMGRHEKNKRADEIIDNSGEKEALYRQIDRLLKKI